MGPFAFNTDEALAEIRRFSDALTRGMERYAQRAAVDVGATARDLVYQEGGLRLWRYRCGDRRQVKTPLLIVYALVNRPYMLDLQTKRSLIGGLCERGLDTFLVDWGYVEPADRHTTLEEYIDGRIGRCVGEVLRATGARQLNLLGVCQGGVLSTLFTARHRDQVRNLVTMVAPFDFGVPEFALARLVKGVDVARMVRAFGNVPGQFLNMLFMSLKPFELVEQKYVKLVAELEDPEKVDSFLRMEQWITDSPDQAGEAFRQFCQLFFQENRLVTGGLQLGGEPVDLQRVTQPILNIFARQDHIVPPAASRALDGMTGSRDYSENEFDGGHIGIYVSRKAQSEVPQRVVDWLAARDGETKTGA